MKKKKEKKNFHSKFVYSFVRSFQMACCKQSCDADIYSFEASNAGLARPTDSSSVYLFMKCKQINSGPKINYSSSLSLSHSANDYEDAKRVEALAFMALVVIL